jgi:type IV secretory pathway VirD2 relaxase
VIGRDYIGRGQRARADQLVTLELGPRTELEVRRGIETPVDADCWTRLDQALAANPTSTAWSTYAVIPSHFPTRYAMCRTARLRKLEQLGLAEAAGPALDAPPRFRATAARAR